MHQSVLTGEPDFSMVIGDSREAPRKRQQAVGHGKGQPPDNQTVQHNFRKFRMMSMPTWVSIDSG